MTLQRHTYRHRSRYIRSLHLKALVDTGPVLPYNNTIWGAPPEELEHFWPGPLIFPASMRELVLLMGNISAVTLSPLWCSTVCLTDLIGTLYCVPVKLCYPVCVGRCFKDSLLCTMKHVSAAYLCLIKQCCVGGPYSLKLELTWAELDKPS